MLPPPAAAAPQVLRCATLVLAEDTRHTRQLFNHFGIATPLHSFHQHNERQKEALVSWDACAARAARA